MTTEHPVSEQTARPQGASVGHVVDYDAPEGATPECVDDCHACEEEQEQDRRQIARAHAAGEHAMCSIDCEIVFPSEQLRAGILYRAIPGSAGMLAELERRAATPPPCSTPECDFDGTGEPCDRHEVAQAHAEGEHELCGSECAAAVLQQRIEAVLEAARLEWMRPGSEAGERPLVEHQAAAVLPLVAAERAAAFRETADRPEQPYRLTGSTAAPGDPALLLRIEQDGRNSMSGCMEPADVPALLRRLARTIDQQLGTTPAPELPRQAS